MTKLIFIYIANSFTPINRDSIIIGGGDLNARDGDVTLKFPYTNCHYRKNVDVTVNEYGKMLIDLCKSFKCFIINNLNIGTKILDGGFTFLKGDRQSQNDLLLTNAKGLVSVKAFQIHRSTWNPSDHTPISVDIELTIDNDSIGVNASHDILYDHNSSNVRKELTVY